MPRISFKHRPGALTAQLVRHRYDPSIKRSRAHHVGALDLRADPDLLPAGLRLRNGESLETSDLDAIKSWLQRNGDPEASSSRAQRDRLTEARVRTEMEARLAPLADPFAHAETALRQLGERLPSLAASTDGSAWATLRPKYLRLLKQWTALQQAGAGAGILRQAKRSAKDKPVSP